MNRFFQKFFLAIFIFSVCISFAHAASMSVTTKFPTYTVGDNIQVNIVVSSATPVNAYSGTLYFPKDLVTITGISKAGSIVSLWAQEPTFSATNGTVSFQGVTLNGYTGTGTVLSVLLKAKAPGSGPVTFSEASVLANDGVGTNVITNSQGKTITIQAKALETPTVDTKPVITTTSEEPELLVEEISTTDPNNSKARFLVSITGLDTKGLAYEVQIDDGDIINWIDDGSHIFTTPALGRGNHVIKFFTKTIEEGMFVKSVPFTIAGLMVPKITDYTDRMHPDEFLVIQGIADPFTTVSVMIDSVDSLESNILSMMVSANEDGAFVYTSPQRIKAGEYRITLQSKNDQGGSSYVSSEYITIAKEFFLRRLGITTMNTFAIILSAIVLLFAIAFMILFGTHKYKETRGTLQAKLSKIKNSINDGFGGLAKDIDHEVTIFRKIRSGEPLSRADFALVEEFKKDITKAKKSIDKEIKAIEKESGR